MKAAAAIGIGLGIAALFGLQKQGEDIKENREDEKEEHEEMKKMMEQIQQQLAQLQGNNNGGQVRYGQGNDATNMLNEMMQRMQSSQSVAGGYAMPQYMASAYAG